jgi:hypothetical protein
MNEDVYCGQRNQWPADDVACSKRAGHGGAHAGWSDTGEHMCWPERVAFGQDRNPVVLVMTGDGIDTESFASKKMDVALANDYHRVVVRMDEQYLTVEVNGGMDLKVEL